MSSKQRTPYHSVALFGLASHMILTWIALDMMVGLVLGSTHKVPKLCLKQGEEPECESKSGGGRVVCVREYESQYHEGYWVAKTVVLCSLSEPYLNPEDILKKFPVVKKLAITGGNVTDFLTDFPSSKHLETLILNNLSLEAVPPNLLSSLKNLRHLDLSKNHLRNFHPLTITDLLSLKKLILTDNPWDCSLNLKWILDGGINAKLINVTDMVCSDKLYPGKPVYSVMSLIQATESECPHHLCSCSVVNIVWDTERRFLVPMITVNCSGRDLLEMPEKLPPSTTTLILKRNKIANLYPLVNNSAYSDVADIYLDHNNLKTIDVLEGAHWLTRFRVLSLRGNLLKEVTAAKFTPLLLPFMVIITSGTHHSVAANTHPIEIGDKQLPTFAVDNAFERNTNMAEVYLGENPWRCDCLFTSEFQHLLIKYRSVVKDRNDVKCAEMEGDIPSTVPVVDISLSSVCSPAINEINPLDILSGVLAALIIFVVGKLLYDYWMLKTTGKLPWIVTKMP